MTEDRTTSALSLQFIEAQIDAAGPPHGNKWDLRTIVDDRLHVGRTATGQPVILLEGDATSFGNYGKLPGASHTRGEDIDSGREFETLVLPAPRDTLGGDTALAHIVYEMARNLDANVGLRNEELLNRVRWVLGLLGTNPVILHPEAQLGLAGECFLLRELLEVARSRDIGASIAIERWVDGARDFAARGLSIEVKTTGQNSRVHHIGSISQLEATSAGEEVFLYSLAIKVEGLHDRKLPSYIDDVRNLITASNGDPDLAARAAFFDKLESRGYRAAHREIYEVGPGLMLNPAIPPRLYRVSDLDYLRLESFKDATIPSMVRSIGYDLELPDGGLAIDETNVLIDLLDAQAIEAL